MKKIKKLLDKQEKICYNKLVNKQKKKRKKEVLNMAKVTKREVLTKVVNGVALTDEDLTVVRGMIEALDKRSSKPTKAQVANEGVKLAIVEVLTGTDTPLSAKVIAEAVGESTNKVAALLKQIEGVVKIEGKGKNPATYAIG